MNLGLVKPLETIGLDLNLVMRDSVTHSTYNRDETRAVGLTTISRHMTVSKEEESTKTYETTQDYPGHGTNYGIDQTL